MRIGRNPQPKGHEPDGRFAHQTAIAQAGVAQSAERLTRNEQVRGSTPLPGSTPSLTCTFSMVIQSNQSQTMSTVLASPDNYA